jgi:hypothetical protein
MRVQAVIRAGTKPLDHGRPDDGMFLGPGRGGKGLPDMLASDISPYRSGDAATRLRRRCGHRSPILFPSPGLVFVSPPLRATVCRLPLRLP